MAGQSSVTLEGGNITFTCPGNFTVKGAQHVFDAGANKAAELGKLPDTRVDLFDEQFHLVMPGTDHPIANTRYKITSSTGEVFEGTTDAQGYTERIFTDASVALEIEILDSSHEQIIGDNNGN
jgi:type VI secretion system secreted protein VgrG